MVRLKSLKRLFFSTPWRSLGTIIGCLVIVFFVLEMTNVTHYFHKQKATSGTIPFTNPATDTQTQPKAANTTTPPPSSSASNPVSKSEGSVSTSSPSEPLVAPYGTLVSNHYPGQNGTNYAEKSSCTTTPGAKCYIKFTQGDIVKTLAEQTADVEGNTLWSWDVKQAGLTSGNWTITAVASLGSETKSTQDQKALEVP